MPSTNANWPGPQPDQPKWRCSRRSADPDLVSALATLPEGFAEVLYYAVIQGYTYAETAEILDIPLGTVMSRVSRGKQRLRLAFAHRAPRRYNVNSAPRSIA